MTGLRGYWSLLGRRLRLSPPGRVVFTGALLVACVEVAFAWAHGAREGGAPIVVLTLLAVGVVALDAVGRGIFAGVRRFVSVGGSGRRS